MQTFLSNPIYLQAFMAALVLFGLGLEGLSGGDDAPAVAKKQRE